MSCILFLDKLLDGVSVEWKRLGVVADIKRGTSITKANVVDGDVPVIAGGRTPAYFHNVHLLPLLFPASSTYNHLFFQYSCTTSRSSK